MDAAFKFFTNMLLKRHFDVKSDVSVNLRRFLLTPLEENGFHDHKRRSILKILILKCCLLILEKNHKVSRKISSVALELLRKNLGGMRNTLPPGLIGLSKLTRRLRGGGLQENLRSNKSY